MAHKITVVGAGSVGSTIAYTLVHKGMASEIVLIDINHEKACGEVLDIDQCTPYCKPVKIHAGSYDDAKGSDVVIITSGVGRKPGQSRLELAQVNVGIIKDVASKIVTQAPDAVYIIVSNPVDVLTYAFIKFTGLPENKVIGTGTLIDTARTRARIAYQYSISQQNVHALVMGEHGDSSFIPWSVASIANVPIDKYWESVAYRELHTTNFDYEKVEEFVRNSGAFIIERKGATYYAIATSVCHICSCIFSGMDTALPVSTMHHGEYGVDDVCISSPVVVGKDGVSGKVLLSLTDEEIEKFKYSASKIKESIDSLNI